MGPSAALNRDPTTTPSVNNPTQTVPQVCVPQQPPAAEPPRLMSRSGQLQEQGFSVEVAVTYIGHYISTLYITYIRHYISALFNLSFMFIHCHKR